jgi:hypothetical protein
VRVRWRFDSPELETEPPTFAPCAISRAWARMQLVSEGRMKNKESKKNGTNEREEKTK